MWKVRRTLHLTCMERLRYMWEKNKKTRVNEYSQQEKQINCSEKETIVNNILKINNENIEYGHNFFFNFSPVSFGKMGERQKEGL